MFCPQCGKKLAGTEKFCPNCGFDLAQPSRSAAASGTATPAGQQAQQQLQPQQVPFAGTPAHAPKAVTAAELVTLTAALLMAY